jgi:integrase
MTRLKLLYVQRFRDRHGHVRHYFRRPGFARVTLPGLPGSAEFMAAYQAALAAQPVPIGASGEVPGSMSALIRSYYAAPAFASLSPTTKVNYRRILERFRAEHGAKPVALIEPRHIRAIVAKLADRPAAANELLSILKVMMQHGAETGMRRDNPAREVRKIRYQRTPFATWSEESIAAFEARWPVGTRARLAMDLMLYTGQRRSDVIRMGRQHMQGGLLRVVQGKTGADLLIPLHVALRASLAAAGHQHLTFLVTESGAPFASGGAFYNWFKDCIRAAGLPGNLSPHGLRKAAARRLAEAGCTPHEIAAITGHATLSEVARYTRAADQKRLAESAITRISAGRSGREGK